MSDFGEMIDIGVESFLWETNSTNPSTTLFDLVGTVPLRDGDETDASRFMNNDHDQLPLVNDHNTGKVIRRFGSDDDDDDGIGFNRRRNIRSSLVELKKDGDDGTSIPAKMNVSSLVKFNNKGKRKKDECSSVTLPNSVKERERRKKIKDMFTALHSMLPQLPPEKNDKTTIIEEAVNYIKTLEKTLDNLQKIKKEQLNPNNKLLPSTSSVIIPSYTRTRQSFFSSSSNSRTNSPTTNTIINPQSSIFFRTWTSPNVVLNIFGYQAQIMVCTPNKPHLFTSLVFVLEKRRIQVEMVNISSSSSSDGNNKYFYFIQARLEGTTPDQPSADRIYQLAARDIALLFPLNNLPANSQQLKKEN